MAYSRPFYFLSFFLLMLHAPFKGEAQVNFESSNLPIVVINTHGQDIEDDLKITADMGSSIMEWVPLIIFPTLLMFMRERWVLKSGVIPPRCSWKNSMVLAIPALTKGLEQERAEAMFSVSFYPVPFSKRLFLNYKLEESGKVRVSFYDLRGSQISTQEFEHTSSGLHTNEINATAIPQGMYLVEIRFQDGSTISKKVVKDLE